MSRADLLAKFKPDKENLLLILHELQNANQRNYITTEDITEVAKFLNVSYSSVYGVVTYYSMFSLKPRGKFIIRVCCSPVCEMADSENILLTLKKLLSVEIGDTTADGLFTLETSECLGQCAESPAMIINDRFFGNLNPDLLKAILDKYKAGKNDS